MWPKIWGDIEKYIMQSKIRETIICYWKAGNETWEWSQEWDLGMRPGTKAWEWGLGLRPGIETWDWDLGMRSKRQPKKTKKFQTLFIVTYVANFQKSFSYKYLTISCDNVLQSLLEGLPQFIFSMINSITATWYCFWHAWVGQEGWHTKFGQEGWHTKFGQKGCKSRGLMNKDGSNMLTLDQAKTATCLLQSKSNIESKRYGFDSAWRLCIPRVFTQTSDRLTQRLHKPPSVSAHQQKNDVLAS